MKFQREGQEETLSESDWDRRMQRDQMEMANKRGSKRMEIFFFFFLSIIIIFQSFIEC